MKTMEKEVMQLEAECEKCKKIYNLDDDLIDVDWNKTIPQALTDKYGDDRLLCPDCRGIFRIIEEGKFKFVSRKQGKKFVKDLVLISKDNTRKVIRLNQSWEFLD